MGLINKMADTIRNGLRDFLNITPAAERIINLSEGEDFLTSCVKYRVWYAGKSNQLEQLYSQLDAPETMFWKAPMTRGMEIRKIHIGLPAIEVDTLTQIVKNDFNGVEITSKSTTAYEETWNRIEKANQNFGKSFETMLTDIGVVGDGAFKLSFDKSVSDEIIIEWYPAERVEFVRTRGVIREVIFYTDYCENRKKYQLAETYGCGYIKYQLYSGNKPVPLSTLERTKGLTDVKFSSPVMWAVPVIMGNSALHKGRGKGIIEVKEDAFDALDEVISQWMDALRAGRTKEYIPDCLLPRNPDTGEVLEPNSFDNRFIACGDDVSESGSGNRIYTESPTIQHESYLSAYVTMLDLCLQGVISPSTLGIDTKKLDNAEAQREKEKTTLYSRQKYVELVGEAIPALVRAAVNADLLMKNLPVIPEDVEIKVKFGEYANPSFESQVETVGKARSSGVMSVEASLDEMYGNSKTDVWKETEAKRIKAEQGIVEEPEPYELDDVDTPIGFGTD